jgi:predicted nucleic acid-binding protein
LIAYPDTSFLCALYRQQDNSQRALDYRRSMPGPLTVTPLLLWEFRQSARFQAFRHSKNPDVGYTSREAEKMISDLKDDLRAGAVICIELDFTSLLFTGEQISKARTFAGGHRSFDLLHVATAVELDAKNFLSFDANQTRLAAAEGLGTPLAGA